MPTDFERQTGPLRPELLAHCYRMLGSVTEAEDQVQETYLRAWKAFHSFEGRASVRTWMYSIATNTCLTALRKAGRRPMPTGLGAGPADPAVPVQEHREITWMEPLPDRVLWGAAEADPADRSVAREGVGLAMVAALQDLPPRQRATLVLREVLHFSAEETAGILDTSVAATNSALQRARAAIGDGASRDGRRVSELSERDQHLWDAFLDAFDRYDVPAVVSMLTADATWEMPPFDGWYSGATTIGELIGAQCPARRAGDLRMLPTVCNGLPAAGMYLRDLDGIHRPFQLQVLQIRDGQIGHVAAFFDEKLFALAGLPAELR